LSGKERSILDYLTEEVLQQQTMEIQTFLLQTSILTQLTSSLCDAVMGQVGSQQILEILERANVFLAPLDGERSWYRYHALFAEALRARLERGEEEHALHNLHRRAYNWYHRHGYVSEAVEHALQAQDWTRAMDLIEAATRTLEVVKIGSSRVLSWLHQLPAAMVHQRSAGNCHTTPMWACND
jgi:LuxR family transcriptional regulator, maltose regulon positive regulatory protein